MVSKEERILRRLFGMKESYSDAERDLARRAIEIANDDAKRSRLPRRSIRIGETVEKKGITFRCVLRDKVEVPADACSGCDALRYMHHCEMPGCSSFSRSDGQNVWFKVVGKEGTEDE